MIRKIDIENFGSFSNFQWQTTLEKRTSNHQFARLNILYGRNYSGKTTLSRIFRSIEIDQLPENYVNPKFCITTDSGIIDQDLVRGDLPEVRVYNSDFVHDNLSFLKDQEYGDVQTFAILGSKNAEIDRQIDEKSQLLGSEESSSGYRHELNQQRKRLNSKQTELDNLTASLDRKLSQFANNDIKLNTIYGDAKYNITKLKKDIKAIGIEATDLLDEQTMQEYLNILREEVLPPVTNSTRFSILSDDTMDTITKTLTRRIASSNPIQELLESAFLQEWVREGIALHRENRISCGFCGQKLPDDLWARLDSHFNEQSKVLENELDNLIDIIDSASETNPDFPTRDSFYIALREEYDRLLEECLARLKDYHKSLTSIKDAISTRKRNIFDVLEVPEYEDAFSRLKIALNNFQNHVKRNNETAASLPEAQTRAKSGLKMNAVLKFLTTIDYLNEVASIRKVRDDLEKTQNSFDRTEQSVVQLEKEIEILQSQYFDEKRGAEAVNRYLNHVLGDGSLRLNAIVDDDEGSEYRFEILRGDEPAYNMSEGECSLISFCYFIARLQDVETADKELVIYIDDPVSSLDSNHIFFVFSLIESYIALPSRTEDDSLRFGYTQLFVSTHNLEFFRYLTKMSQPRGNQGSTEFYVVEKGFDGSRIGLMPDYLKNYQTEFHYLFHQIYRCANATIAQDDHHVFYNFGNNLRKFLEAYLFYRYPYKDSSGRSLSQWSRFFGEDETATALANRLSNEFSHLEKSFDRSMQPLDIPEMSSTAKFVLDKMQEVDAVQFGALMKSIGEFVPKQGN